MNRHITIVITILFIGIIHFVVAFAEEQPKGPIKVTNYGKKGAVTFNHSIHDKDIECKTCHHKKDSGNYKCGTSECHLAKKGKTLKLKDAAHKKKVGKCWGCHFKKSPKVKKPLKCNNCHLKK